MARRDGDRMNGRGEGHRLVRRSVRFASPAIADQILSSGSQLLLVVLIARESSAATFGAASIALLVYGFLLGAVRALVGDVAVIRCRRPGADANVEAPTALFLALVVGGGSAALLGGASSLVGGEVGHFLALFAIAVPIAHGQDAMRSVAYGSQRIGDAVIIDGTWLAVQVAATIVLFSTDRVSPTALVVAWMTGAAVSLAVACGRRRVVPDPRRARRWTADDGRRSTGFLADFVVSTGAVQASFLALGAVLALAEFGYLRLAFVSIMPLANVLAGVRSLILARLAGSPPDAALATARRAARVLAGAAVLYGTIVTLAPTDVGVAVFGDTWTDARSIVAFVALSEVLRLAAFPAVDLLRVLGAPGYLVRTRLMVSAALVAGILGGGALGGPGGAALGVALAQVIGAIVWWRRAGSVASRRSR